MAKIRAEWPIISAPWPSVGAHGFVWAEDGRWGTTTISTIGDYASGSRAGWAHCRIRVAATPLSGGADWGFRPDGCSSVSQRAVVFCQIAPILPRGRLAKEMYVGNSRNPPR